MVLHTTDPSSRPTEGGPGTSEGATRTPLTQAEAATLDRVKFVSTLLDEAIRIPGTQYRIGLDPFLTLLPVAGDVVAALISLYPVVAAYRLGVSKKRLAAMLGLVAVDAVTGLVPVVGTVFDAVWKANEWNYRLIEGHLEA